MMTVIGPLLVLALVIAFRLRRTGREKPLSGRFLWLAPTLYAAVVLYVLVRHPPDATGWALAAAGLLMGAGLGWHRGQLFGLRLDPRSGTVLRRRPPAAVLLLAGVIALRFIAGGFIGSPANLERGSAAMLLTDLTLGFLFGLLTFTRLEIAWRARRLLAAQRS
uniref:CcdC protein domain-containing protein n=1 Tax=uncultured Sphingomonas sp. TaxID=158754 RepID=UPI0025ED53D7|nr:CcdC protein domain-containing protein [uncultured Sphingomonas sp.]